MGRGGRAEESVMAVDQFKVHRRLDQPVTKALLILGWLAMFLPDVSLVHPSLPFLLSFPVLSCLLPSRWVVIARSS
jgi:hypothetical protein